jgi:colicin import membrane protein
LISFAMHRDNFALTAGPPVIHATALFNTPMKPDKNPSPLQAAQPKPLIQKKQVEHQKKTVAVKNKAATVIVKKQKAPETKTTTKEKPAIAAKAEAVEQSKEASQQAQIMQGVVDQYKALILQAIGQNWIIPPGADKQSSAELFIRLAPDGTVISVKLIKSSGNPALDESAITAVQKASPLPVPNDLQQFNAFRQINLVVKPDIILV